MLQGDPQQQICARVCYLTRGSSLTVPDEVALDTLSLRVPVISRLLEISACQSMQVSTCSAIIMGAVSMRHMPGRTYLQS